jgi:heat-inducible transcriptional repressor
MDTRSIFLKEKDRNILDLIVDYYLKNGKPVSSGLIAQKSKLKISPATVRNIMAKLERMGFLSQPHTSAGRIPTDEGLRMYVNNMLSQAVLPKKPLQLLSCDFESGEADFDSYLAQVTKALSEYSDNLGFVISPSIAKVNLKHLRFIKVSEGKIMIILVTTSKLVLTEVIRTVDYYSQVELDRASHYINENFRGKNLWFVHDYLLKEVPKYKLKFESIIKKLMALLQSYVSHEEREGRIFFEGTSRLLSKSEWLDQKTLHSLFRSFEEKTRLSKLLSDIISLDRVKVLIGSELDIPDITDCSLILSHYGYDSQVLGSLGILGPKRIPYKKIIPIVDSVAKRLSETISSNH